MISVELSESDAILYRNLFDTLFSSQVSKHQSVSEVRWVRVFGKDYVGYLLGFDKNKTDGHNV